MDALNSWEASGLFICCRLLVVVVEDVCFSWFSVEFWTCISYFIWSVASGFRGWTLYRVLPKWSSSHHRFTWSSTSVHFAALANSVSCWWLTPKTNYKSANWFPPVTRPALPAFCSGRQWSLAFTRVTKTNGACKSVPLPSHQEIAFTLACWTSSMILEFTVQAVMFNINTWWRTDKLCTKSITNMLYISF